MRPPTTRPNDDDVSTFIASIENSSRREDCEDLIRAMWRATRENPRMWGSGTVGFGSYHYRYATGREGDWFKVGFAPRARKLTIYLLSGLVGYEDLLSQLGPHSRGRSCIYVRRLTDVDRSVLDALIDRCVAHIDQVETDLGALPRMSAMPPLKS